MPEYKWKLKNKKFCTRCPMNHVDYAAILGISVGDLHFCRANFYAKTALAHGVQKKRPAACVRELGD